MKLVFKSKVMVVRVWKRNCTILKPCHLRMMLKELEHRKLGWKVLILKYDLGKSLSKEMWCKMADIKNKWLHILKDKNACNMRSILFVSVDKKMIYPHNELYIGNVLVCAHFSSKLAHGTYCLCCITQLFRLFGIC